MSWLDDQHFHHLWVIYRWEMVVVQVLNYIDFAFLSFDKFAKFLHFFFQMLVSHHQVFYDFVH